jgi:acyl-CoA dehydrogenase
MVRLLTLKAAWLIDTYGNKHARTEIAAIKVAAPEVALKVIDRAIQIHGSLGFSTDMPLEEAYRWARAARFYDGPDEVHKVTVARRILRDYEPRDLPTDHVPTRREAALAKYGTVVA